MKEYKLTNEQKNEVDGQLFAPRSRFYPFQDINDVWFLSKEEVDNTVNPEFLWVKDLPYVDYVPKPE